MATVTIPGVNSKSLMAVNIWARTRIPSTIGRFRLNIETNLAAAVVSILVNAEDEYSKQSATTYPHIWNVAARQEIEDGTDWNVFRDRIDACVEYYKKIENGAAPHYVTTEAVSFSLSELEEAMNIIRAME